MADVPLTPAERSEIARVLWRWFREFTAAGFSDDQSLRLCAWMLRDTL